MEHLTPGGVLTFSRWYFRDRPGEVWRLTSLAAASLTQLGIENPHNHIVVVACTRAEGAGRPDGVGTLLVSKAPFSDKDLDSIEEIAAKMQFEVVLSPRYSINSTFATIASGKNLKTFPSQFPMNIAPPTDDSPFFFHMLRLQQVFNRQLWQQGRQSFNMEAVFVLAALAIIVTGLTFLCIIVPLILTTRKRELRGTLPLFVYFACIGFGFMFVEISQMQRLMIFLGHPTYGLSVVLFTLLLFCGLGSYWTKKIKDPRLTHSGVLCLLILLCSLVVFGTATPYVIKAFRGSITALRILVATAVLCPLGVFMGTAFPLGMKIASAKSAQITPWLWGINGATSVCASVLAVAIALSSSISTSFWTGFSCYVLAFASFAWEVRRKG